MEFDKFDDFLNKDCQESPFGEFCLGMLPEICELDIKHDELHLSETKNETIPSGCNCVKTKCIKLYCECFANGNVCGISCKCKGCNNTPKFETRNKAIRMALEKNPLAFQHSRLTGTRGCSCRRSGCKKKYCECFLNGIQCSALCKCEMCQNLNYINKQDYKYSSDFCKLVFYFHGFIERFLVFCSLDFYFHGFRVFNYS